MLMEVATTFAAVIPDISPEQPPGTEGVNTLLNWFSWGVIIVGLAGFFGALAVLGVSALTGREVTAVKGLVISIIVCILAVSVGVIMRTFI